MSIVHKLTHRGLSWTGVSWSRASSYQTSGETRQRVVVVLHFKYVDDNRGGEEERKEGEDAADELLDGQQSEKLHVHNRSRSAMPSPHTS